MTKTDEFGVTQSVKIKEGNTEIVYPLYDLTKMRAGVLFTDDIPSEIPDHISQNCAAVKERLEIHAERPDHILAICGYGPTLKEWVDKLRNYRWIMTTSGAHKFLNDRGIVPTYHVDVDFRQRKAIHTKEPNLKTEYYFASMCHPDTIANTNGFNRKLWHIKLTGITYPDNALTLDGYWDVGQEAILVAKALGFRQLHLFGYDYAFEVDTGETHAGFHNAAPGTRIFAKVGNRYFQTSDSLCRGVMVFTKLMEDNPDLTLTIHSSGLLSAYLQHHYQAGELPYAS